MKTGCQRIDMVIIRLNILIMEIKRLLYFKIQMENQLILSQAIQVLFVRLIKMVK